MILHVISGLAVGGTEASLLQVAAALQGAGIRQHVAGFARFDAHVAELRSRSIGVRLLGVVSTTAAPSGALRLARLIRRLGPHLLHG